MLIMQEYRRFFRYLMPSLVLIIEVFIYLLITDYKQIKCFFQNIFMNSATNGNSIATLVTIIITAFLASGGFGYLLGTIYHILFFHKNKYVKTYLVDHLRLLKNIRLTRLLQLRKLCDNGIEEDIVEKDLNCLNAWHIITSFIHERVNSSERIKGAINRLDSLADIMHGAGTTFIGSWFAVFLWYVIHYKCLKNPTTINNYFFILPIIIIIMHFYNFLRIAKAYQGVINIIILDELYKNFSETSPLIIRISEMDLKKSKIRQIIARIFNYRKK